LFAHEGVRLLPRRIMLLLIGEYCASVGCDNRMMEFVCNWMNDFALAHRENRLHENKRTEIFIILHIFLKTHFTSLNPNVLKK
jgi:hypothetical protein